MFYNFMRQYLENGTKCNQSYCKRLIGSCIYGAYAFEWHQGG